MKNKKENYLKCKYFNIGKTLLRYTFNIILIVYMFKLNDNISKHIFIFLFFYVLYLKIYCAPNFCLCQYNDKINSTIALY